MKEATGELNMTAITLVAIGAILAFFYIFIWPSIKTGLQLNTACSISGGSDYTDQATGISCGANGGPGAGMCQVGTNGPSKQCRTDD